VFSGFVKKMVKIRSSIQLMAENVAADLTIHKHNNGILA